MNFMQQTRTSAPPSHKRSSSSASNLTADEPPSKQSRKTYESAPDTPQGALSNSSSSSDDNDTDDESPLNGVYIVQYNTSNMNDNGNDIRILGVYVSEEDAYAEVSDQRKSLLAQYPGAKAGDIEDLYQSGWSWDDYANGKNHSCSVQFHKLIWPSRGFGSGASSSPSSSGSSNNSGRVEDRDVGDVFGARAWPLSR
ncbi:hypothetical protein B0T17DRAFT_619975 [Bombardia bombarda]|uniref:Uncharacterized protein n=1 Tax=Bombardia bombarda TaxID=252184 RepID=A0AA40BVG5_9PEZI|nr:hypothetical protein B0T17DRAFT_619975 [Bombardia bombarda]